MDAGGVGLAELVGSGVDCPGAQHSRRGGGRTAAGRSWTGLLGSGSAPGLWGVCV